MMRDGRLRGVRDLQQRTESEWITVDELRHGCDVLAHGVRVRGLRREQVQGPPGPRQGALSRRESAVGRLHRDVDPLCAQDRIAAERVRPVDEPTGLHRPLRFAGSDREREQTVRESRDVLERRRCTRAHAVEG